MRKTASLLLNFVAGLALCGLTAVPVSAAEPIKIGFGMALTGGLAASGKAALLAMQIWEEDTNAKGGLLGRPVKLIYYDDQSNPATVPGIYTKLLDVDKVDLVVGDYGTNLLAPAMPIVMQHKMTFLGLFGLDVNDEFHYPKYFSMVPTGGPNPAPSFSKGFFEIAAAQNPKPQDHRDRRRRRRIRAQRRRRRARQTPRRPGSRSSTTRPIRRPPPTTRRSCGRSRRPIPMSSSVASYPPDSVGMVRAVNEVGLKTKMFGGGMVGLQYASIKTQLGPLLNGIVDYDFWEPAKTLQFPGVVDFLKKYQAKAAGAGVDPLGYYLPPFAYANLQVLAEAVDATKSLDQDKLADYLRKQHVQDHRRRHQIRPERRMGRAPRAGGPVPRHKRQRLSTSSKPTPSRRSCGRRTIRPARWSTPIPRSKK